MPAQLKTVNTKTVETKEVATETVEKKNIKTVILSETKPQLLSHHTLCRLQHIPCDSPVRAMFYSTTFSAFIALHTNGIVCLYKAYGHKQILLTHMPFTGLMVTKIPGYFLGWGPGSMLTLMDCNFHPLVSNSSELNIQTCGVVEHCTEVVTAGLGNVCVWSIELMHCKKKILEGLQEDRAYNILALASPQNGHPYRAFVTCGHIVTVINLKTGKVMKHKTDICSSDITAMLFCFQLNFLIIACQDLSITVWDSHWEPRVSFLGHKDVVNHLHYCGAIQKLVSCSVDNTICMWNVEDCEAVQRINTGQQNPPLHLGSSEEGDIFFSFSLEGVDFWIVRNLYTFFCAVTRQRGAVLRHIAVSNLPAPYPSRVLCISGNYHATLLSAETGAVLTYFKAPEKILHAEYCMYQEHLFVLTENGVVIKANTLTNPITVMNTINIEGHQKYLNDDFGSEVSNNDPVVPGQGCSMALYTSIADTKRATEDWLRLQERRGCASRTFHEHQNPKNRVLIIVGQSEGYITVLKSSSECIMFRTPAHNGQKVTAIHPYPEKNFLFTAGQDCTVIIWRIHPYADDDCLTQQVSLQCNQLQLYLATLGTELAMTSLGSCKNSYTLKFVDLLSQKQSDYKPADAHSNIFTGLCVAPEFKVFISCSLDKTLRIWNNDNHFIRTLHLQAVPLCLAYGGFGEIFLGIKGNLYRMKCSKFMTRDFHEMVRRSYVDTQTPDVPIATHRRTYSKTSITSEESEERGETDVSKSTTTLSKVSLTASMKEEASATVMDESAPKVVSPKEKITSTKETRKEAFNRYMNIVYDLPSTYEVDNEDRFCFGKSQRSTYARPYQQGKIKTVSKPQVEEKKETKKNLRAFLTVKEPSEEEITISKPLQKSGKFEKTNISLTEKTDSSTPDQIILPPFLKQFAQKDWFHELFPDEKEIPRDLTSEEFCLQLADLLQTAPLAYKIKMLSAINIMHSQGLLPNTDRLYDSLFKNIHTPLPQDLTSQDRLVLRETLHIMTRLQSDISPEFMKDVLTLLASKQLGVREIARDLLEKQGVKDVERFLLPEMENWDLQLPDKNDAWKGLHRRADWWLENWLSKYKVYRETIIPKRKAKWAPQTFSIIHVLNFFCKMQREDQESLQRTLRERGLDPLHECSSETILRYIEANNLKKSKKRHLMLPPLMQRPSLMEFPNFITLPLPRITLSPFEKVPVERGYKETDQRCFFQEQSLVEYYRR